MRRVINVCFHGIGEPARDLESGEARYWVGADRFLRLLDVFMEHPEVRLSFDDGNASDVTHALPALQARGLNATFFVLAGRLDQPGSLGTADLRSLDEAGMTVGTHGMDHRPWRSLGPELRQRELVDARAVISAAVGRPVDQAACPLGRYDRALLGALRSLGYRRIFTSDRGWTTEGAWLQPRTSVLVDDTVHSARRDILAQAPLTTRAQRAAVTLAKRLR